MCPEQVPEDVCRRPGPLHVFARNIIVLAGRTVPLVYIGTAAVVVLPLCVASPPPVGGMGGAVTS